MGFQLGIDFGSTCTKLAVVDRRDQVVMLGDRHGGMITPTVVQVAEDWSTVIGEPARAALDQGEEGCMFHFKPFLGTDTPVCERNGNIYTAIGPTTLFFRRVLEDAAERLRDAVDGVVVTVPTLASYAYCDELRSAVGRSNVRRVELIPTSVAVALDAELFEETERTVLVCDLGATSLEVAVLRVQTVTENDKTQYRARLMACSEANLGTDAWDDRFVAFVMSRACQLRGITADQLDEDSLAQVLQRTRLLRQMLIDEESARVPMMLNDEKILLTVTRQEMNEQTDEVMTQLAQVIKSTVRQFEECEDAGEIDWVVPAGGGALLSAVVSMLNDQFPGKVQNRWPAYRGARGAAKQAQLRMAGAQVLYAGRDGCFGGKRVKQEEPEETPVIQQQEETRKADGHDDQEGTATERKMPGRFSFGLGKYNANGHWGLDPLAKVSGERSATVSRTYRTKTDNQDALVFFTFAHTGDDEAVIACDLGDDIIPYPPTSQGVVRSLGKVTVPLPPGLPRDTVVKATFEIDETSVRVRLVDMNTEETYHVHELKKTGDGFQYEVL